MLDERIAEIFGRLENLFHCNYHGDCLAKRPDECEDCEDRVMQKSRFNDLVREVEDEESNDFLRECRELLKKYSD